MSSRLPRDGALEKEDRIDEMKKKKKTHRPAPAASTVGPCPTICQNSRTSRHWKLPSTIARPNHHFLLCDSPSVVDYMLGINIIKRQKIWKNVFIYFELSYLIKTVVTVRQTGNDDSYKHTWLSVCCSQPLWVIADYHILLTRKLWCKTSNTPLNRFHMTIVLLEKFDEQQAHIPHLLT